MGIIILSVNMPFRLLCLLYCFATFIASQKKIAHFLLKHCATHLVFPYIYVLRNRKTKNKRIFDGVAVYDNLNTADCWKRFLFFPKPSKDNYKMPEI